MVLRVHVARQWLAQLCSRAVTSHSWRRTDSLWSLSSAQLAVPTISSLHVLATKPADNGLRGNREWHSTFTSLSHYNLLLHEGGHGNQTKSYGDGEVATVQVEDITGNILSHTVAWAWWSSACWPRMTAAPVSYCFKCTCPSSSISNRSKLQEW